MYQRHIFTALAIIAVTGAVSDRHIVARGGLEGAPLLYAQFATGIPAEI